MAGTFLVSSPGVDHRDTHRAWMHDLSGRDRPSQDKIAFLKPAIELLAGIPSVVYGLFAMLILQRWVAQVFGLQHGYVALNGGA
jgi:hypothetical protein